MRSDAREAAFKIVYAGLFHECEKSFYAETFRKAKLTDEERDFAMRLVALVEEHREELSAILAEKVTHYAEYRIFAVDRAILLTALAEILYCDDVPSVVSVSEAAAIARKYSTENSASFVNGVLGGVINQ